LSEAELAFYSFGVGAFCWSNATDGGPSGLLRHRDRFRQTSKRMSETTKLDVAADDARFAVLAPQDAPAFAGFTYPSLTGRLDRLAEPWFAVGARAGEAPVGLALGQVSDDGYGLLTSLSVDPDRRGRGIGRLLVSLLSQAMRAKRAKSISARIGGGNPSRPALDRALTSLGWPPLDCVEIRVLGHAGAMAREGGQWQGVRRILDDGVVSFERWSDFNEREWRGFDALVLGSGLRRSAREYLSVDGIEPQVSVVLRRHGEPVGWVVGRHVVVRRSDGRRAAAIGYSSAYVEPTLARRGFLIGGFWHAFSRQAQTFGSESIAVYQTPTPRMIALSRRRFVPIALETNEVFASVMPLG
jgi:GNAT superfamily N-acetyltransferase